MTNGKHYARGPGILQHGRRAAIFDMLCSTDGNKTLTASRLGISRETVARYAKEMPVPQETFEEWHAWFELEQAEELDMMREEYELLKRLDSKINKR